MSSVRSIGNPYVSYRRNASSPLIVPRRCVDPCVDPTRRQSVEPRHAAVDRREEPLLFRLRGFDDVLLPLRELGYTSDICATHFVDEIHERRRATAEQPRMTHRRAEMRRRRTSPFVRREHAIRQQERHGARVIREHAERRGIDVRARSSPPLSRRRAVAESPCMGARHFLRLLSSGRNHRCGSCS
jgi:hypothetical protein